MKNHNDEPDENDTPSPKPQRPRAKRAAADPPRRNALPWLVPLIVLSSFLVLGCIGGGLMIADAIRARKEAKIAEQERNEGERRADPGKREPRRNEPQFTIEKLDGKRFKELTQEFGRNTVTAREKYEQTRFRFTASVLRIDEDGAQLSVEGAKIYDVLMPKSDLRRLERFKKFTFEAGIAAIPLAIAHNGVDFRDVRLVE